MFTLRALALSTCMLALSTANAAVSLLGVGSLPATATDLSGLTGTLESGVAKNLLSVGSGIAYTGQGSRFIAVPDRGPNANPYNAAVDDTTSFQARMHEIDIAISGSTVTPTVTKTTLFSNEAGVPLTGLSSGFDATNSSASSRFDPEGVRVSRDGQSVFVSDEYGPFVYQFDRNTGRRIRVLNVPAKFKIAAPNSRGATEISGNTSGRVSNRGMEGLAITPDGSKLKNRMNRQFTSSNRRTHPSKPGSSIGPMSPPGRRTMAPPSDRCAISSRSSNDTGSPRPREPKPYVRPPIQGLTRPAPNPVAWTDRGVRLLVTRRAAAEQGVQSRARP